MNALEELAPTGVRLPELAELAEFGRKATEVDGERWKSDLIEVLGPKDA